MKLRLQCDHRSHVVAGMKSQSTQQLKNKLCGIQEDAYHVFNGILNGFAVVLIFFWIPFVSVCVLFGWWCIIVYPCIIVITASATGLFCRIFIRSEESNLRRVNFKKNRSTGRQGNLRFSKHSSGA